MNELAFQMKKSTHILNISACFAGITWKGTIHSCRCRGCVIKSTRLKLVIMTPPKEQIYILFFNKSSKIYKPFYQSLGHMVQVLSIVPSGLQIMCLFSAKIKKPKT